jgi:hypothetical protein
VTLADGCVASDARVRRAAGEATRG